MRSRSAARERLGLAGLVVGGFVAGFLALEVALQLAAWVRGRDDSAGPSRTASAGVQRILAVGDSNTYGLYLVDRRREAYPAILAQWSALARKRVDVVNLGFPGLNSSAIYNGLPAMLEAVRPQTVLVMIGINDAWTVTEPIAERDEAPTALQTLWSHSRVVRLLFMLKQRMSMPEPESPAELQVEEHESTDDAGGALFRYGDHEIDLRFQMLKGKPTGWRRRLADNVAAIVQRIRDFGAEPVILTYPSSGYLYKEVNGDLRAIAKATGTRLIDLAEALRPFCPTLPCPDVFYEDNHPTARGHALAGRALATELARPAK